VSWSRTGSVELTGFVWFLVSLPNCAVSVWIPPFTPRTKKNPHRDRRDRRDQKRKRGKPGTSLKPATEQAEPRKRGQAREGARE
jgi:hypothetical protein